MPTGTKDGRWGSQYYRKIDGGKDGNQGQQELFWRYLKANNLIFFYLYTMFNGFLFPGGIVLQWHP